LRFLRATLGLLVVAVLIHPACSKGAGTLAAPDAGDAVTPTDGGLPDAASCVSDQAWGASRFCEKSTGLCRDAKPCPQGQGNCDYQFDPSVPDYCAAKACYYDPADQGCKPLHPPCTACARSAECGNDRLAYDYPADCAAVPGRRRVPGQPATGSRGYCDLAAHACRTGCLRQALHARLRPGPSRGLPALVGLHRGPGGLPEDRRLRLPGRRHLQAARRRRRGDLLVQRRLELPFGRKVPGVGVHAQQRLPAELPLKGRCSHRGFSRRARRACCRGGDRRTA
jgi:hypothetical protein